MKTKRKCKVCGEVFFKRVTCSVKEWKTKCKFCSKSCWYKHYANVMKGNTQGFTKGQIVWNKGKPWSEEMKRKLSEAHLGLPNPMKGKERPHKWTGDKPSYSSVHKWIVVMYGKPTTCEHCGKTGLTGQKINWANTNHEYKKVREEWMRLCAKCHRDYDKEVLGSNRF